MTLLGGNVPLESLPFEPKFDGQCPSDTHLMNHDHMVILGLA